MRKGGEGGAGRTAARGELPRLPLRLSRSRTKYLWMLLGSLTFVAMGLWMAREDPFGGYGSVAFFGLCGLVSAVQLHPRASYLELDDDGFTFCSLFRECRVAWTEVAGFTPVQIHLHRLVGWNYSDEFRRMRLARGLSAALSGAEAALPDVYGMAADDLAALMNAVREQGTSAGSVRRSE